jgi:excisionase family DNA binding protein
MEDTPGKRLGRLAYGPREVSEMTGLSESGVRNLIKRGTLRAVRWDGRWLIPARVLEEIFEIGVPERREVRPQTPLSNAR